MQRRLAGGQIEHTQIGEEHAAPEAGTQRLGGGFLGRKALGIGRRLDPLGTAAGLGAFSDSEHSIQEPLAMAGDRRLDAADVADIRAKTEDHPRSTPRIPTAPRSPAMTLERCDTSRTSTSTSASMKSDCRLTIFRLVTAPSCLAIALVRLARAVGSFAPITLSRAV